ncbi:hypothetical protein JCM33374_g3488 [Metschnikowia sp. JCM 33374]|nr:hypothetical protein JCM33374_g3488 [Metschnikowia sp. JCM 33374]
MPKSPRIIYECPNVENTLPLELFRAQSPARYSQADGDKLVLYAGNGNCLLEFPNANPDSIQIHERLRSAGPSVAVFVLDTSVIFWFSGSKSSGNGSDFGVEMPYPSIVLHALKEIDGESVLYLQVLSCDIFRCLVTSEYTSTVEVVVRVRSASDSDDESRNSPLLAKNNTVQQMYESLGTCSAFHYDSESDADADADFGVGQDSAMFGADHEWITADSGTGPDVEMPVSWVNSGDADDLGMADASEEEVDGEAGMNVAVEYVTVAGVVRRRASVSEEAQKQRRIS